MANKKLNAQIVIGGAISGSLRSAFGTVKKSTADIGSALKNLSSEQRQLNEAMKRYGHSAPVMERLNARYSTIVGQVERLRKAQERLNAVERASAQNLARRAELRGQMLDTFALGAAVAAPIKIAADRETHAIGIAKQLQGARDEAGKLTPVFWQMRKAVTDLGHEIPLTTNDLYDMAAAGLRMGIASKDILGFTRNTAKLASALELDPAQVAEQFAKIGTVYKLSQDEIVRLGDAVNYLDDQTTAKGGEIIDFLQRVGGSASLAKLTAQDMAAIGTTLISMGESADTAGTSVRALVSKLTLGNKNTKAAREAFKEMGYTANEVGKSMQLDGITTIQNFFKTLARMPAAKRSGILVSIFGQEHVGSLAKIADNIGGVTDALKMAKGEMSKGSVQKEFQNTTSTTAAQMVILKNRMSDVADNIGTVLLPSVNDAASAVGKFTTVVANFAAEHPGLTKAVVGTAVALTSLKVATLAGGYAFTFMKGSALRLASVVAKARAVMTLMAVRTLPLIATQMRAMAFAAALSTSGFSTLSTRALPAVATAIRLVGAAFITTGIGAIITAIALGGLWIYRNWDLVKATMKGVWSGLMDNLEPVRKRFADLWEQLGPVKDAFGWVGEKIQGVYGWFKTLLDPVASSKEELKGAGDAGKVMGKALADGIEIVTRPVEWLIDSIKWLTTNLPLLANKAVQFKNFVAGNASQSWTDAKNMFGSWDGFKASIGLGDEKAPPSMALPMAPQMATNRGAAPTITTNDNYEIRVIGAPGMDTKSLAREVAVELRQQQSVRNRSMMPDGYSTP